MLSWTPLDSQAQVSFYQLPLVPHSQAMFLASLTHINKFLVILSLQPSDTAGSYGTFHWATMCTSPKDMNLKEAAVYWEVVY